MIETAEQHEAALEELRELLKKGSDRTAEETARLKVLAESIETYEKQNFPIDPPTPEEQAAFRAEQEPDK